MTRVNKRIDIEIGHFVVANLVNFSEYTNRVKISNHFIQLNIQQYKESAQISLITGVIHLLISVHAYILVNRLS